MQLHKQLDYELVHKVSKQQPKNECRASKDVQWKERP